MGKGRCCIRIHPNDAFYFQLTTVLGGSLQRCFLRTVPPSVMARTRAPRSGKHRPSSPLSHSLLSYRSVVEAPPPHSVDQSFVALHVLSFLSRNRIFLQIQIYRAFLNTAGLFIWHIICKIFRNFTPHNEPNAPLKRLPLRTLKASQVFSNKSPNFKAYHKPQPLHLNSHIVYLFLRRISTMNESPVISCQVSDKCS